MLAKFFLYLVWLVVPLVGLTSCKRDEDNLLDSGIYSLSSDCSDATRTLGFMSIPNSSQVLNAATGAKGYVITGLTEYGLPTDTIEITGPTTLASVGTARSCEAFVFSNNRDDILFSCFDNDRSTVACNVHLTIGLTANKQGQVPPSGIETGLFYSTLQVTYDGNTRMLDYSSEYFDAPNGNMVLVPTGGNVSANDHVLNYEPSRRDLGDKAYHVEVLDQDYTEEHQFVITLPDGTTHTNDFVLERSAINTATTPSVASKSTDFVIFLSGSSLETGDRLYAFLEDDRGQVAESSSYTDFSITIPKGQMENLGSSTSAQLYIRRTRSDTFSGTGTYGGEVLLVCQTDGRAMTLLD